jgi:prepilin-type N-terminal cleavage/methylation domain-containing protein
VNNRKAFTLVELIVVIGIIAILAGILLPAVNHMRRSAQITGQKADFQAIASALEAYQKDFGDYPRNIQLPIWNTSQGGTVGGTHAPIFLSLATALLGPGPAVSNASQIGDGADGLGFRCQMTNVIPGTATATVGSNSVTFAFSPTYAAQFAAMAQNFVSSSATPVTITLGPSIANGQYYSETLGVSALPTSGPLTTVTAAGYAHSNVNATLSVPGGKIWGPYISADTFKVAFVPAVGADPNYGLAGPSFSAGQPILLDRWGQVIQYFPRYGPANNRTNDSNSLYPAKAAVQAGPLFGYSQPNSVDTTGGGKPSGAGENAIWDYRDGAPFFTAGAGSWMILGTWPNPNPVTGNIDQVEPWPKQTSSPNAFQPELTIEWMLGNSQTTGSPPTGFTNLIQAPDKLNYDGPYILISAGPDGPERNNGGYCNFINPITGEMTDGNGNPLTSAQLQQIFIASGNIYNFDRP